MILGTSSYFLLVSKGTKSSYGEDSYTLSLSLLFLPFLPLLTSPFWTYRDFQKTDTCVFVCTGNTDTGLTVLQCCVHCKFNKHRQFGNSNSNELVAFIIFLFLLLFTISSLLLLLTCLCYWHHNGHCFYSTPVPIWFCFPCLKITALGKRNVSNLWASLIYLGIVVVHLLNQVLSLLWLLLTA